MIRRRVVARGRVHGVGFRASCRAQASRAGVAGWVRNLPGDAVEAVFEGDDVAVGELVAWMAHGPRVAVVTATVVTEEPPEGLSGFAIRP